MVRTLIRAHTLLTQSATAPTVSNGGIAVEDGVIRRVGPLADLERDGPYDAVVGDAERHLALPGLVNGHHHTLRPARMELGAAPLESWIVRQRFRQLPPLSAEEVYDHTLWGTLQFMKAGMTSVVDHYPADPRQEDYGVPPSVQAYLDAGVRAALCIACQDQRRVVYEDEATFLAGLPADLAEPLRGRLRPFDEDGFFALWERLAARFDGQAGRIRVGFGPGGPQWCTDGLLQRIRRVADDHDHAPVQIHLLESRLQALFGLRHYGHSVVRHLNEVGFFGAATSCAHCVWVSHEDVEILAASGATAIHNPSSNALLFNGVSPVADLLDGGVRVGFGLDTAGLNETQDALTDLRLGLVLQRRPGWDRRQVTPSDMLALATHGGAPALGMGVALGRLEAGYQADVVLVDRDRLYGSPYVSPAAPAEEVLLRRATAADVDHVLVGGRLVVEGGRAVGIDEDALAHRVADSLAGAREMLPSADDFSERLQPYVADFYRRWEAESAALLPPNYVINTR